MVILVAITREAHTHSLILTTAKNTGFAFLGNLVCVIGVPLELLIVLI